jgi:hypothetical protein
MTKKFPPKKGFYGFTDDRDESSRRVGYQGARRDDNAGTHNLAGHGVDGADDSAEFLRPSSGGIDYDAPHERLAGIIDGQYDQPAGKLLGGGGPVSDNKHGGVGPGRPRFAPKNLGSKASQHNYGSKGGVDRRGR